MFMLVGGAQYQKLQCTVPKPTLAAQVALEGKSHKVI
jgi:hypothetical protein